MIYPLSVRNGLEINIGKEWDRCIDRFGTAFSKECAESYRENIRRVVNEHLSFWDWCVMKNGETGEVSVTDAVEALCKTFTKGTRVRLIKYGGKHKLPLGLKGTVRSINKNADMLIVFDNKRTIRLNYGRDVCEKIPENEESHFTSETLVSDVVVLHKRQALCRICGRILEAGTHFRSLVFRTDNELSTIEACSQCVRYIRNHGLTYDRNGLRCLYPDKESK